MHFDLFFPLLLLLIPINAAAHTACGNPPPLLSAYSPPAHTDTQRFVRPSSEYLDSGLYAAILLCRHDVIAANDRLLRVFHDNSVVRLGALDNVVLDRDKSVRLGGAVLAVHAHINSAAFGKTASAVDKAAAAHRDIRRGDALMPPCLRRDLDRAFKDIRHGAVFDQRTAALYEY